MMSNMMKTSAICAALIAAFSMSFPLAVAIKSPMGGGGSGEDGDEGCNNAGQNVQVTVTGDNSYKCQWQHCVSGGGAGAAGAGVGTGASTGEAAAQATAGQDCKQGDGGDPDPSEPNGLQCPMPPCEMKYPGEENVE